MIRLLNCAKKALVLRFNPTLHEVSTKAFYPGEGKNGPYLLTPKPRVMGHQLWHSGRTCSLKFFKNISFELITPSQ